MILNGRLDVGNLANGKAEAADGVCAWETWASWWLGGFSLGLVGGQRGLPGLGKHQQKPCVNTKFI